MQSNVPTGSTALLNERFTLVLLAHDQSTALRRALHYYSESSFTLLVVDSSSRVDTGITAAFSDVQYLHAPTASGFGDKVRQAVEHVVTPYLAVADAESFLLPLALEQAMDFLEAHGEYGACQGYSVAFEAHADRVDYYLLDRKGCEDYSGPSAEARLSAFAEDCPALVNALTRTETLRRSYASLPAGFDSQLQEAGHSYGVVADAKVRLLDIPYGVHERSRVRKPQSQVAMTPGTQDMRAVAEQERLAITLAAAFGAGASVREHARGIVKKLAERSVPPSGKLFESTWDSRRAEPVRRFEPTQYVELPFYNQAFFDVLATLEFLLHAAPSGQVQLKELEAAMLKQKELSRPQRNTSAEPLDEQLARAFLSYAFNQDLVKQLLGLMQAKGDTRYVQMLQAWDQRLKAAAFENTARLFDDTRSGRLLRWLEAREPSAREAQQVSKYLAARKGGPTFGILILDLEADIFKMQATFDSIINGYCRAFKIVVFTTGDLPAETTPQSVLHFVKVNESNYVDKINQVVSQSDCDWMVMAEAGDELTPGGLFRAGVELLDAPCQAVAMDEFQRQPDGTLADVFRPGFNLDLLQSNPAMMGRHWLIRRETLVKLGGYSREFKNAMEFDLLLRLIEQDGLEGLAHLDEPLLICQAPVVEDNADERKTLLRHLAVRGYQADVSAVVPGTHKIDYRFAERPMVSIIVHGVDDLTVLQRGLLSVLQRTRYQRYEVLVPTMAANHPVLRTWLDGQGHQASRVRLLDIDAGVATGSLINAASQEAKGDYLVALAADSEVVNVNWIESLLNQALRPEVGVVGAKLVERDGRITQAGLILGLNDSVGSAFVGESKTARGYMNRLVVEQNCSAVSFGCLMISKQLFEAADGIDTGLFDDALGDVDLCLRVGQAGYLTVWTPHVQLIQPGVLASTPQALAALREKWSGAFAQDRFYNGNLALQGAGFALGPVRNVPWTDLLN
ncbi:TIGR00180 family glycosyltransferase [Pseudomonas brassicacearum]|uniref:TIGR00180 family glycosyltransferase n=1 Tax=Pseudomonas brassicacearum subsp. neoaurantiaca TaxID=494916 RepID=A0A7V8RJD9_9PSED|nr:TIGR00180 family glycosyltransferase [Pseudomonas brassicacearum]MBA1377622.1 TIGR00180 family glycosyltransferase [Pseudomonas brassicacearum subsp. neoaurantiaca]